MNKIFKVLWSKTRACWVAVDENRTSSASGKVRTRVVRASVGLTVLFSQTVLASAIQSGWGNTVVNQTGNKFDISSKHHINGVGINKFNKFELSQGHIANLQFGSSNKLINFVNDHIKVDGTVNGVLNNKIGGDLFFVSPTGMTVGSTGVINAGSLTTTIVAKDKFQTLWDNAANPDPNLTTQLQTGDGIPLNPKGVITVAGSINAGNNIALLAGNITVKNTGRLTTGVDHFKDLVNIKDATGNVTVSSGLAQEQLTFQKDEATGDILLLARAEGALVDKPKNNIVDGKLVPVAVDATITVEKGAKVTAKKDVTIKAQAGNGAYKDGAFVADKGKGMAVSAKVTLDGTIKAGGQLNAKAEAVNKIDHKTGFNLETFGEQFQAAFSPFDKGTFEYVDMSTTAKVSVGKDADLEGQKGVKLESDALADLVIGDSTGWKNYLNIGPLNYVPVVAAAVARSHANSAVEVAGSVKSGGDLTLRAKGTMKASVATTAIVQDTKAPQASVVFADFAASSKVTVKDTATLGAVEGGKLGHVTIEADQKNSVVTKADTLVTNKGSLSMALNVTTFDSKAKVELQKGLEDLADRVTIASNNLTEKLRATTTANVGDFGIIAKIQGKLANVMFEKVASLAEKYGVKVGGNVTGANFQAGGALTYIQNAQSADVAIKGGKFIATNDVSITANSRIADHIYGAQSKETADKAAGNEQIQAQGAMAVLINTTNSQSSAANVRIDDGVQVESQAGNVTLEAKSIITKDRAEIMIKEFVKTYEDFLDYFNKDHYQSYLKDFEDAKNAMLEAFAAIDKGDTSAEQLSRLAKAMEKMRGVLDAMVGLVAQGIDLGEDGLGLIKADLKLINPYWYTNAFVNAGGNTTASGNRPTSVAGAIGVLNQSAQASVTIGRNTTVKANKDLKIGSETRNENVAVGGLSNAFFGIPLPQHDKGTAIGGSTIYQSMKTDNLVKIEGSGTFEAGRHLSMTAKDGLDILSITAAMGTNAGGLTANGLVSVTDVSGKNNLLIDDDAKLKATDGSLQLAAERNDSIQAIAASLGMIDGGGEDAGLAGIGLAVNLGDLENTLAIENQKEDTEEDGRINGQLTAKNDVAATAESHQLINAVGASGQAASATGPGQPTPNAGNALNDLSNNVSSDVTNGANRLDQAGGILGEIGDFVFGAAGNALSQTGNASGTNGNYDGLQTGTPSNGLNTSVSNAEGTAAAKKHFNFSGAGSVAVNDMDQTNVVRFATEGKDGTKLTVDAQNLAVEAVTDKFVGAFAGSGAMNLLSNAGAKQSSVGIGGAAAANRLNAVNRVEISGLKTTDRMNKVSVQSLVDGTTVAQGLGMALSKGGDTAVGIDAGISVNLIKNQVGAEVSGLETENKNGDFIYDQTAWTGETQVTGGTAVGVAGSSGQTAAAAGAAVAVGDIHNQVTSTLKNAKIENANKVNVDALVSLTQVNTAVGAQAAFGGTNGASLNGSVIASTMRNDVSAGVDNAEISLQKNGQMSVTASAVGTSDGEVAQALKARADRLKNPINDDILISIPGFDDVVIKTDANEGSQALGDMMKPGSMLQVNAALSGAGSNGKGGSVGGAVIVTDIDNTFKADSNNLTLTHDGSGAYHQEADAFVSTVNVATGVAATQGQIGATGSVIVANVDQKAHATANNLTLTGGQSGQDGIKAVNRALSVSVAGNVGVQTGGNGGAMGAAVVVNQIKNDATVKVNNLVVKNGLGGELALEADNEAQSWAVAAAGTVGGNAAVDGAVAVNRVVSDARVDATNLTLGKLSNFKAEATDKTALWTLAGAVSAALKPGSPVAGGLAFTSSTGTTKVDIDHLTTETATNVTIEANAQDQIKTMTIGGAGGGSAALAGSVAKNEVARAVEAALTNMVAKGGRLTVNSQADMTIGSLGLTAAGGKQVAGGIGVSMNTIDADVKANASHLQGQLSGLDIAADSRSTITSIGVGGAGAGGFAALGSTAVNHVFGDTVASLTDSNLEVAGASAVRADSDDLLEAYAGQAQGSGTAALGLSITTQKREGSTKALVDKVTLTQTSKGNGITYKGGVTNDKIHDAIVDEGALTTGNRLGDERDTETTDGITVAATNTTTYKSMAINAGAAGNASVAGAVNVVEHNANTEAVVTNATLTAHKDAKSGLQVKANDAMNATSVMTAAGGAMQASGNLAVSQVKANGKTNATVTDSTLKGLSIEIDADRKAGVSHLTMAAGAAGGIALDAVAGVTHLGGDVNTLVKKSDLDANTIKVDASSFNRINHLAVSVAGTTGVVGGAIGVGQHTVDTKVKTDISDSQLDADKTIDVTASQDNNIHQYGAAGAAALQGAAVGGMVAVNRLAGTTSVNVSNSHIGSEKTDKVTIAAKANDRVAVDAGAVGVGTWVGAGAMVAVNELTGAVGVNVDGSQVEADNVTVEAANDRAVTGTLVMASGSLGAGLGANVMATTIGSKAGDYESLFGHLLGDETAKTTTDLTDRFADLSTDDLLGEAAGNVTLSANGDVVTQSSTSATENALTGTTVKVTGSTLKAKDTLTIKAAEDMAEGSGVKVTLGSGNAGMVSLAGSVGVLNRHHGAAVDIAKSHLEAKQTHLNSLVGSKDDIQAYQGSVGMISGNAAVVSSTIDGGARLTLTDGTTIKADQLNAAIRNTTATNLGAHGLTVAGIGAGAAVATILDGSNTSLLIDNVTVEGLTKDAKHDATFDIDRAQTLTAKAEAGYGGAITGVGAKAVIFDTGRAEGQIKNLKTKLDTLTVDTDLRTQMRVDAGAAGGSLGAAVGVVQGHIVAEGASNLRVEGSDLQADKVNLSAQVGEKTDNPDDAMRLEGHVAGYGGSALHIHANQLMLINKTQSKVEVVNNTFAKDTALDVTGGGHVVYRGDMAAIHGGLVTAGSNHADIEHGLQSTVTLTGNDSKLGSLTARVQNSEDTSVLVESAGGGVIVAQGDDAASIDHKDSSNAKVSINGSWQTAGAMDLAATTLSNVRLTADNTKGGLGAFSGAYIQNTQKGASEVVVGKDAKLVAGGDLRLRATTDWTLGAARGDHMVKGEVYGGVTGSGIGLSNTYERDNRVTFEEGSNVRAEGSLVADAKSNAQVDARVLARTAGAFNAIGASIESTIRQNNQVLVQKDAALRTTDPKGALILAASGTGNIRHDALTRVEGSAIANADSRVTVNYSRADDVSIQKDADVFSGGRLILNAGAASDGKASNLTMKNRSESFSYAFLSGINAGLDVKTNVSGVVNVEGDAASTTDAEVTADSGDWTVAGDSLTHYWGQISKNDHSTVAIKGAGQKNTGVTEEGRLNVTGKLEAGVNTRADIVIDGLLNPEGSGAQIAGSVSTPNIKVEAGSETAKNEILAGISGPLSDAQNNVYWQRYEELGKLIQEYAGLSDKESSSALVAYKAERKALFDLMKSKGWVDEKGNLLSSQSALFVKVDGVTVSGGNIRVNANKVTGDGKIAANAAEGIKIQNNTNATLQVGNIQILEKGGNIELNGVQTGADGIKRAGFTGQITEAQGKTNPSIQINSSATTGSYEVVYADGKKVVMTPKNGVVVTGRIDNQAGDVSINAQGDLLSMGNVSATGTLSMKAGGSITQSYSPGVTHVGGDPSGTWKDEIDKISSDENYRDQTIGSVSSNKVDSGAESSQWVAGGAVIISGDLLNINGVVQSGFSEYEINLSENELQNRIDAIKNAWQAAGSPVGGDVKQPMYQIQAGTPIKTADGSYKLQVACWYDPVNDRIVLDDIVPEGGAVYISGKIASTGGGKIFAADGSANVFLDAKRWSVLTGEINTEAKSAGRVVMTDQFFSDTKNNIGGRVTEFMNGSAKQYFVNNNGDKINFTEKTVDATFYDPKKGLLYTWTEGKKTTEHYEFYKEWVKEWWGLSGANLTEAHQNGKWSTVADQSLTTGGTITDSMTRPDGASDDKFYAWITKVDDYDSGYIDEHKQWSSGFLGFYKHDSIHSIRDKGNTSVITYTVKADERIGVDFLKGQNKVNIQSGRDVLLGGDITAKQGSISIKAEQGSILAHKAGASLNGANNITLNAGGSIGTADNAIRINGGSGTLNLSAKAGQNIHLDATGLGEGRKIHASHLSAGNQLHLQTKGDIVADRVQGADMMFKSEHGKLDIRDLVQLNAPDGSQRFDASAAGDITLNVSSGDLALGLIESKSGDVSLTVANGSVLDAQQHEKADELAAQERLEAWESAGVIGSDGSSLGLAQWEADVEAAKTTIKAEFDRYQGYLEAQKSGQTLTPEQTADLAKLAARYEGVASADEAIKIAMADSSSQLAKTVASKKHYGWTADDLMHSIADNIINGSGSDVQAAKPTNIRGKNVTIKAGNTVGTHGQTITGSLATDNPNRLEILEALAQADIGDFTSHNGVVSVTLKKPITIEATGNLNVEANNNIFIASADKQGFVVDKVVSSKGDVSILAQNGITAAKGQTLGGLIGGRHVTLRGGTGGLGDAERALQIRQTSKDGWTALAAGKDIFVKGVYDTGNLGDLTLYSVAGDQNVTLTAKNLYAVQPSSDEDEDYASLGQVRGDKITFNVSGDVGSADRALQVNADSTVAFGEDLNNLYLAVKGKAPSFTLNDVTAHGNVHLTSDTELNLTNMTAGRLDATSKGDLTVVGKLTAKDGLMLTAQNGTLTMTDAQMTGGGAWTLDATNGIEGTGAKLNLVNGTDLTLHTNGNVNLAGGALTVDDKEALGNLTITGQNVDVSGFLTAMPTLKTENLAIKAKDALTLGNRALVLEATGNLTLTGDRVAESGFAAGTQLTAGKTLAVSSDTGLTFGEGSLLKGDTVALQTGGSLSLNGTTVEADDVTMTAEDALKQTGEQSAIVADRLTATAGGALTLDGANRFLNGTLESGGDIALRTTGGTTALTVNASKNGQVAGNLKVLGLETALTLTNNLTVKGDALIHAGGVKGQALVADGAVEVSDVMGEAPEQGIVFDGAVSGTHVTMLATGGDLRLNGGVTSTKGSIDLYRTAATRGDIVVTNGQSQDRITIINGHGDVKAESLYGQDTVFAVAGQGGQVYGESGFTSQNGKAGSSTAAEGLMGLLPSPTIGSMLASSLTTGMLPTINFSGDMLWSVDTMHQTSGLMSSNAFFTPMGNFFFLNLRSDAKLGLESEDEDKDGDESQASPLVMGLPTKAEPVIRDLREAQQQGLPTGLEIVDQVAMR